MRLLDRICDLADLNPSVLVGDPARLASERTPLPLRVEAVREAGRSEVDLRQRADSSLVAKGDVMAAVEIRTTGWFGDRAARDDEEADILYASTATVDGVEVRDYELDLAGSDFATIEVLNPSAELWDKYADPARHLHGTNRWRLVLPITELVVRACTLAAA